MTTVSALGIASRFKYFGLVSPICSSFIVLLLIIGKSDLQVHNVETLFSVRSGKLSNL